MKTNYTSKTSRPTSAGMGKNPYKEWLADPHMHDGYEDWLEDCYGGDVGAVWLDSGIESVERVLTDSVARITKLPKVLRRKSQKAMSKTLSSSLLKGTWLDATDNDVFIIVGIGALIVLSALPEVEQRYAIYVQRAMIAYAIAVIEATVEVRRIEQEKPGYEQWLKNEYGSQVSSVTAKHQVFGNCGPEDIFGLISETLDKHPEFENLSSVGWWDVPDHLLAKLLSDMLPNGLLIGKLYPDSLLFKHVSRAWYDHIFKIRDDPAFMETWIP